MRGYYSGMLPHLVLVGSRPETVGKMLGVPAALSLISRTGTDDAFERKIVLYADSTDINDPERLLACVRRIHERRPVHAILGGTEHALLPASIAGEALGVRVNPAAAVRRAQDKSALRRRLAEAGAESVAFRICPDAAAAGDFYAGHPRGIVLKPADGNGGRGVFVVRDAADIPAAWDHVAPEASDAGVLAEEFLAGTEVSVETMSADGQHRLLAVTAKHTSGPPHRVEVAHEVPGGHAPALAKAAADAALAALDAVGYAWGPAHTEVIVGDDGRAAVVEINARQGGDRIWELVGLAAGVDMARAAAMALCYGELPAPRTSGGRACAVRYLTPRRPGRIVSVTGADDAAATGGVIRIGEMSRIGDVLPPLADWRGRTGYVLATGPTPEAAHAVARDAAGRIRVQTIPARPDSGPEALSEDVRDAIRELLPSVRAELERMPTASAEEIARLLRETGAASVRVAGDAEGAPAVIARYPGPRGMPTALLHGRLGQPGIAAHVAALRFFGGRPPVGATVVAGDEGPGPYREERDAAALVIGAGADPGSGDFENACAEEVLGLIELARRSDKAQPPRPV